MADMPGLENELNSLQKFRNKFAHNELILDEEKIKEMKTGTWLRSINRKGNLVEESISADEAGKRIKLMCLIVQEGDRNG